MSPDDSRRECVEKRAPQMAMATVIVLVGMLGTLAFRGPNPRAPIGG
jgi:hypothetical protein